VLPEILSLVSLELAARQVCVELVVRVLFTHYWPLLLAISLMLPGILSLVSLEFLVVRMCVELIVRMFCGVDPPTIDPYIPRANAPLSILRHSYAQSTMVSIGLRMHWLHLYPSSAVAVPPSNDCRFLLLMSSDSSALFGISSFGCFQSPTDNTLGGLHAIPNTVLAGPIVVGTSLPSL
jgi:hypothetical protein